ncbi:hypothetical protein TNCV_1241581 [Trichonephila clavipes]|nr:hypothetical protein TNCV_1241581 [Trichonephila clavipes]
MCPYNNLILLESVRANSNVDDLYSYSSSALTSSSLGRPSHVTYAARGNKEVLDRCSLPVGVKSQKLLLDEFLLALAHVSEGKGYFSSARLSRRSEKKR